MRIVVVGSGYVGLVSGACLSDIGHTVICVDTDAAKVDALKRGEMPIYEPGLGELVAANVAKGHISFSTEVEASVKTADVVIIAVGTPARVEDGRADLTYIHAAARSIAPWLKPGAVVVTKSTVPVGTGDEIEQTIATAAPDSDVTVVSNPEFLREGAAIDDFMRPDRIVVGCNEKSAESVLAEVYRPLTEDGAAMLFVSRRTAELIKYASNAFLAVKISFINEIADLCEAAGADVRDVSRGMGLDTRIGPKFLQAGPGYGGSCFPKDTQALANTAADFGAPMRLVETTIEVNDARKRAMAHRVVEACGGVVAGKRIGILGLTFKPNTDDMREAPSIDIIHELQRLGAKIHAYDPEGHTSARAVFKDVEYARDPYHAAQEADAIVFVTEWNEFRVLDLDRLRWAMKTPAIVDLRNICPEDEALAAGFTYRGIGLGPSAESRLAQAAE